jgi:hypothetical protein
MNSHVWIVFDGRSERDTSNAAVLEACSSRRDLRQAIHTWRGHDAIIFEYENLGGHLEGERRIGHVSEGKRALLSRCTCSPVEPRRRGEHQ